MPLLLAIETSQRVGGVALRDEHGGLHIEMLATKKRHDDDLLPAIDRVFDRAGASPRHLAGGAVAVSIGPGGFTGLRIAVATAKMFAETLGTKFIAVPSAVVAAQSTLSATAPAAGSSPSSRDAMVGLASKDDSCWCTRVRREMNTWRIVGHAGLHTAKTLEIAGVFVMLADEHLPEPLRILCEQYVVSVVEPTFDPSACLLVAEQLLREGVASDPLTITPLYPREPEAVKLWNARRDAR